MMEWTEEQSRAIAVADRNLVIMAGAGSGKTRVLAEIACRLLQEHGVAPSELAVITFTEKAAGELRERISSRLGKGAAFLEDASIGTIHSFAAGLLRRYPESLPVNFTIWDEDRAAIERSRVVQQTLASCFATPSPALRTVIDEYGWRRLTHLLTEHLGARWKVNRTDRHQQPPLWRCYRELYDQVAARYREHKQREGALDFEALEEELLRLLSSDRYRRSFQSQFRHILVDEYQDTSFYQHEIIHRLFHPERHRLIIVGDLHQSIYRFRGALVELFPKARDTLMAHGGAEISLTVNFRSTQPLIAALNKVFAHLFGSEYQPMQGIVPDGTIPPLQIVPLPPTRWLYERREIEAEQVTSRLMELLARGIVASDCAILFRSRAAMTGYEAALGQRNIPYRTVGGKLLLECQEILDQIQCFRALLSPEDRLALAGVMLSPLGGFSAEMLWVLRDRDWPQLLGSAVTTLQFSAEEQKVWDDFARWWQELRVQGPRWRASELAHRIFLRARRRGYYASGLERAHLGQWIAWLNWIEQNDPLDMQALLRLVEQLRADEARLLAVSPPTADEEGVRLLTIHAAKGLEFDHVVLADLGASFPSPADLVLIDPEAGLALKTRDRDYHGLHDRLQEDEEYQRVKRVIQKKEQEEAKRLLYVACTRARKSLILPLDTNRKRGGNTWNDWLCEALEVDGKE